MSVSRRTTRYLRIGFTALLVFSAAQVSWWILDQWLFTGQVQEEVRELHREQAEAARRLLEVGMPDDHVETLFPDLTFQDGGFVVDPAVDARLQEDRRSRLNRYLWEGSFFFVVLLASIGVIARALREDASLRRRQQNFLASVSHELKSPLASARIAAETLELRDPPTEQRQAQVARILRSIERLENMIGNLLETVRLEEGELALRPRRIDLGAATAPVADLFAERGAEAGVSLTRNLPRGVEVLADEAAVGVVLRNLLDNAFKAVEGMESARVTVSVRQQRGWAVLEVQDNGKGFRRAQAGRLFDKFYRPGDEMQRGGRGAGLGLHIVREVMTRSGGSVHAHSDGPGRGALFVTRWPLCEESG